MRLATRGFLFIAIAWILIVCYSVLLGSAAESIIEILGVVPQDDGSIRQIAIFLYGLAVVSFLGGSQIPAIFLRKKSFVIQFAFSAAFGLILSLLTLAIPNPPFIAFFRDNPVIALEYLSIPYLCMIFLDLYSNERLNVFSWKRFFGFLGGAFLHPRRVFEELSYNRSVLFSFMSVVLVSTLWTIRAATLSHMDSYAPARWDYFLPQLNGNAWFEGFIVLLGDLHLTVLALVVPTVLLSWVALSGLIHIAAKKLGGQGNYISVASLAGFSFLPASLTIIVDLVEISFQAGGLFVPEVFLILGFLIPLVAWPFTLVVLAVRASEGLSTSRAGLTAAIAFMPLFILIVRVFS